MVTTPEWLSRHGGDIRQTNAARSWAVFLNGEPQYVLVPAPVTGKYGCRVTQSINGRRLDSGTAYPSLEEALQGGLEDLRKVLGW